MRLTWRVSGAVSGLNAARRLVADDRLTDRELTEVLEGPAERLAQSVGQTGLPAAAFWHHLLGLRGATENARDAVERAVAAALRERSEHREPIARETMDRLSAAVAEVEAAVERARPRLEKELTLRAGPLRQLWEARGPGLLKELMRSVAFSEPPESAEIVLVHPVRGGDGFAYPPERRVVFEGVLANPMSELPEVARLGWLLAQLAVSGAAVSGETGRVAGLDPRALALVPATLSAAEYVEVARCDPLTVAQALEAWHVTANGGRPDPRHLLDWWNDYRREGGEWREAVERLREMMAQYPTSMRTRP